MMQDASALWLTATVIAVVIGTTTWRYYTARSIAERWLMQHRYRVRSLRIGWFSFTRFAPKLFRNEKKAFEFRAEVEDLSLGGTGVLWLRVWTDWIGLSEREPEVTWDRMPTRYRTERGDVRGTSGGTAARPAGACCGWRVDLSRAGQWRRRRRRIRRARRAPPGALAARARHLRHPARLAARDRAVLGDYERGAHRTRRAPSGGRSHLTLGRASPPAPMAGGDATFGHVRPPARPAAAARAPAPAPRSRCRRRTWSHPRGTSRLPRIRPAC